MKYPEQLFVYCNENDDCSWDCNEQETWNGEVQYVLQSEYDCLQERVQELETERRWIPVSERMPEEGQTVSEALSQLTNKELAEKLISDVWGLMKLFGEKSDLLTEAIERLFVLDTPDRVRCTKDGEYPEDDITVLAEFHGVDFADIPHIVWFEWDNAQWVDFLTEEIVPNVPEEMTVYWRPLTSLKDEYERQKDGE